MVVSYQQKNDQFCKIYDVILQYLLQGCVVQYGRWRMAGLPTTILPLMTIILWAP